MSRTELSEPSIPFREGPGPTRLGKRCAAPSASLGVTLSCPRPAKEGVSEICSASPLCGCVHDMYVSACRLQVLPLLRRDLTNLAGLSNHRAQKVRA